MTTPRERAIEAVRDRAIAKIKSLDLDDGVELGALGVLEELDRLIGEYETELWSSDMDAAKNGEAVDLWARFITRSQFKRLADCRWSGGCWLNAQDEMIDEKWWDIVAWRPLPAGPEEGK